MTDVLESTQALAVSTHFSGRLAGGMLMTLERSGFASWLFCSAWPDSKTHGAMAPGITETPYEVPESEIQDEHGGDGEDQVLHNALQLHLCCTT